MIKRISNKMYHSFFTRANETNLWSCEYAYQIKKLYTTCSKFGWQFTLTWLTRFMISMSLVEFIAKLVCKSMKPSLHLYELISPKDKNWSKKWHGSTLYQNSRVIRSLYCLERIIWARAGNKHVVILIIRPKSRCHASQCSMEHGISFI